MNIPHSKHSHTSSWENSKREDHTHSDHPATTNDNSFFNRVFGHHSSDSSRAGSPIPPIDSTKKVAATTPTGNSLLASSAQKKSRHSRNSSTGSPISIIPTHIPSSKMQRRRSFDGMEEKRATSKKLTPTPLSSVSARVTSPVPSPRPTHPLQQRTTHIPKINTTAVPFPRGGRQIGQTDNNSLPRRSNSIERGQFREDQPTKKRHLWRFGKKKATTSSNPTASSIASSNASNNTIASSLFPRKKSSDLDYRPLLATNPHSAAADVQRSYYQQQSKEGRKKSAGSSGSGNSFKKRETEKDQLIDMKLDQNFEQMEGIVNTERYRPIVTSNLVNVGASGSNENTNFEDPWLAPDSWRSGTSLDVTPPSNVVYEDFEDYPMNTQEKWAVPKKNAKIKIFRHDKTHNVLEIPLSTTTLEILNKLANRIFTDMNKHNLVLKRQNVDRILGLTERPLEIQKLMQEQMGYTDQDNIEDTLYLLRFELVPIPIALIQEDKEFGQNVDIQFRSLATIPIYLYKHASRITSLDVSKNLQIEIPLDFIQMCTNLKELWLANNEYTTLPPSTQHILSLENLNITGNRLRDLDHANLHEIPGLRIIRAVNNKLQSIPDSFATAFRQLTTLYISNNFFTKFPMVICEITTLEYLDISFNKIQMFPEEIGQLVNLVSLFAIANRITGALPASFMQLTKLQELDIRQNLITDLDVISHLPRLEILLVDYNSTSIVNFEIKSLRQLKMYKNHLTQFNLVSSPGGGHCLTELNLSCCKLSSLPENLFDNIRGLETLVLDSNTLNAIPSSIGALQKLVTLSIQNNNLETLPEEVGKLSELKMLDAQKNNLKSLPKEIWLCSSLETLNCSSNLLEAFPEPLSTLATITPSAQLSSSQKRDDISDMALTCDDNDSMNMLSPALNAGQGSIKRLDHSVDFNTRTPPPRTSSVTSPVTPDVKRPLLPSSHSTSALSGSFYGTLEQNVHPHQQQQQQYQQQQVRLQQQQQQHHLSSPNSPPNFNPPSFFASPRNHPPPLSLSLEKLFLGDNRLTDDVWSPLSLFLKLRTLNLSFNDLYEIPPHGLCHQRIFELYLSGNQLTSLPADDIERLQFLRVLSLNGNKLQTLPAEIGKLRKLLVLDVGNNMLKYNIANYPYDWNWNWNLDLKYLNLSGNTRLEINKAQFNTYLNISDNPRLENNKNYLSGPLEKDLSSFSALTHLRVLGLMDITLGATIPDEFHDRRVRTSDSVVNGMSYGIADWLGSSDHLSTWDLVTPKFRQAEDECIFALFDAHKRLKSGCPLTKHLYDGLIKIFTDELKSIKSDDTIVSAMRRSFLKLQQSISNSHEILDKESGSSAAVCYISGTKLHVANIGDVLAVISRNNGQAFEITQKHIALNPSEVSRIRAAGGYVSNSGLLNDELNVSRSFGHYHLMPVVNCNPFVSTIDLAENDEFVIMASRELWNTMNSQTAVDIARTEKDNLMAAAQKLRDFAITYGAEKNLMVMVIGVGDLFDKREKRYRNNRGNNMGPGRSGIGADAGADDGMLIKSKRRGKEEVPGDSTLARLEREVAPPVSQLALVFTDIKSSTQFWETQPENMRSAIKIHDAIMRRTLRSVGGYEVKTEGDAFMVCFKNITAALLWCFTVQLQLLEADWPAGILDTDEGREIEKDGVIIYRGLSVRMGIHWGSPVFERNPITQRMDYFGPVVNKASRISSVADGGQICVSSDVIAALRNFPSMFNQDAEFEVDTTASDPDVSSGAFPVSRDLLQLKQLGFNVVELGERRLKGLETPETLSLVYSKQLLGRIEVDKSELMSTVPLSTSNITSPQTATSVDASPALTTSATLDSSTTNGNYAATPVDYLTARPITRDLRKVMRTIDPNLVCAMSNLAIRLERLTSGNVLSQHMAGSSIQRQYTFNDNTEGTSGTISTAPSGLGLMLDRHIREDANDEELMIMMENCVARVENAVSSMYLQKMGRFAGVLEKLGESIDMDPMYIIKALQMYAEATSLASNI